MTGLQVFTFLMFTAAHTPIINMTRTVKIITCRVTDDSLLKHGDSSSVESLSSYRLPPVYEIESCGGTSNAASAERQSSAVIYSQLFIQNSVGVRKCVVAEQSVTEEHLDRRGDGGT